MQNSIPKIDIYICCDSCILFKWRLWQIHRQNFWNSSRQLTRFRVLINSSSPVRYSSIKWPLTYKILLKDVSKLSQSYTWKCLIKLKILKSACSMPSVKASSVCYNFIFISYSFPFILGLFSFSLFISRWKIRNTEIIKTGQKLN